MSSCRKAIVKPPNQPELGHGALGQESTIWVDDHVLTIADETPRPAHSLVNVNAMDRLDREEMQRLNIHNQIYHGISARTSHLRRSSLGGKMICHFG